jgi:ABC-type transport system involved in multi-copper enzyme maturation permease subunit
MTQVWLAQMLAVIRLEVKKTFFAKRGLWIYLLAAMPLALFIAHAVGVAYQNDARARLASRNQKQIGYQDLAAISKGMSREEVIQRLGKPPQVYSWKEQRQEESGASHQVVHESYHYSDGASDLHVRLEEGTVTGTALGQGETVGENTVVFAGVFQFFYLRLAIFFGCLGIFMNLFRGELLDKSLHFYFLAPIRRDVLMLAKYFAGLLAATVIFVSSELLQFIALCWSFNSAALNSYLYHGNGLAHAAAYLGITALACIGYGSLFLAAGLWFRNPILPAAVILIWEALNPFLPSMLQKISVIYYLKSLCPVEIPASPDTPAVFALLISNPEPIAAPVAIIGLILVSMAILFISSRRVRHMEINYTTE